MNTNDFDFELPEELIAQTPLKQRDASKLLVIDPVTKEMTDTHFDHIIDQLNPEPYPYLRKPAETTFYPARKDGWAFYYAFCRHAAL